MFAHISKNKLTAVSGSRARDAVSVRAMENFRERLRRLREKRGLSQEKLGELSGVGSVHMIESRGSPRPPYETVVKLARALDVDPDDLAGIEPPPLLPALAEFLETPTGKTATKDEIERLRRLPASGKRPTKSTYELALSLFRSMPDAERPERK